MFFLSLSLICLSFRSTTFALLALVQQCNKDVRKFMTPLIPSKAFRLCYVKTRCFLLWKRRQGSSVVTCKAGSYKYGRIPVLVQLPNPTTCYTFTLYADIFHCPPPAHKGNGNGSDGEHSWLDTGQGSPPRLCWKVDMCGFVTRRPGKSLEKFGCQKVQTYGDSVPCFVCLLDMHKLKSDRRAC